MAVIGSDGLSLLVGNGETPEIYSTLKGATITHFEIIQRGNAGNAIAADAWQVQVGTSNRYVIIECASYANDEAATLRIKELAMNGTLGNFKLQLRSIETLLLSAFIIQYREEISPADIKRMRFRLESSGTASLI